jgi:acetolactate synthase small subunit
VLDAAAREPAPADGDCGPAAPSTGLEISAEHDLQALCRIFGALSLYDVRVRRGTFAQADDGRLRVRVELAASPEAVERLVKRLQNLVDVHAVRRCRGR